MTPGHCARSPQGSRDLEPSIRRETIPFLSDLTGLSSEACLSEPLTFQVFDDWQNRKDLALAATLHGTILELQDALQRRNQAGAGVFVTVNQTDFHGRSKNHVRRARGWWADLDHVTLGDFAHHSLPLQPSTIVSSGHGLHLYWWATEPLPCATTSEQSAHETDLRGIQHSLRLLGADPSVCEVSRVMRLPGFSNQKRLPHEPVTVIERNPVRYTREFLRAAFDIMETSAGTRPSKGILSTLSQRATVTRIARAQAYAEQLARTAPAIAGQQGSRVTLRAAIKVVCGFALDEETGFQVLLEAYNPACQPPWRPEELRRKVQEALRVTGPRGWLLPGQTSGGQR